jgi:hypothetical protein
MPRELRSYTSYAEFKNELIHHGSAPFSTEVEELADEMYNMEFDGEFDSLWDRPEADGD